MRTPPEGRAETSSSDRFREVLEHKSGPYQILDIFQEHWIDQTVIFIIHVLRKLIIVQTNNISLLRCKRSQPLLKYGLSHHIIMSKWRKWKNMQSYSTMCAEFKGEMLNYSCTVKCNSRCLLFQHVILYQFDDRWLKLLL